MAPNMQQSAALVKETGLIAIIRGDFSSEYITVVAEMLLEAGIPVIEVTLNSRGALDVIAALKDKLSGALVGAGTVRSPEQVEAALAAGAQFIVSPNFEPAAVAVSREQGVLHLPGIFTATEAHNAFSAGCKMVKLFPADAMGPTYLKALRAPLNDIEFVPTGGVTPDNLAEFVRAGAVACGIGSALISSKPQSMDEISTRARAFVKAWQSVKSG